MTREFAESTTDVMEIEPELDVYAMYFILGAHDGECLPDLDDLNAAMRAFKAPRVPEIGAP